MVNHTNVIDVSLSSTFLIGDAVQITPSSKALAVQRQVQLFFTTEGDFDAYPIFNMQIPKMPLENDIKIKRYNISQFIKINQINVISVSASSIYQIGSNNTIDAETRIKHIRQLHQDLT